LLEGRALDVQRQVLRLVGPLDQPDDLCHQPLEAGVGTDEFGAGEAVLQGMREGLGVVSQ